MVQATLASSSTSGALDTLSVRQAFQGWTAAFPDVVNQHASEAHETISVQPEWMIHVSPVKQGEAFRAIFDTDRKALQEVLTNVHYELQSAASPALADAFRTAIFTPSATREQKEYALISSSAAQEGFLQPVATFLRLCLDWIGEDNNKLPDEAVRMIKRLNDFLQSCRAPDSDSESLMLARRIAAIRSYEGIRGSASVQLSKRLQAEVTVLVKEADNCVRKNCELLRIIYARLAEIECRQNTRSFAHTGI